MSRGEHRAPGRPAGELPASPSCLASPQLGAIPIALFADTYKATHPLQYPACTEMSAYGEFRRGYDKDKSDTRIVNYGMRHIVETYLHRRWTQQDIDLAEQFYSTHCAGGTPLPWPRDLFQKIVSERGGHFPITLQALPEGTCAHAHVPAYQITAKGEFAPLCLFFETLLTQVWYPTTVATLSRRTRDLVEAAFERGADGGAAHALVPSRLHDFGMRGCCTGEQAVLGGCAHLLSFDGTDTMPAAFHAQFHLNGGRPVGSSIPATVCAQATATCVLQSHAPICLLQRMCVPVIQMVCMLSRCHACAMLRSSCKSSGDAALQEHSVMTAWPSERAAMLNMIDHFGEGTFACVMDSYDYAAALEKVLPSIKSAKVGKGGYLVLRPDSGDPVDAVLLVCACALCLSCNSADLAGTVARLQHVVTDLSYRMHMYIHAQNISGRTRQDRAGPARSGLRLRAQRQRQGVQGYYRLRRDPGRRHQHRQA
jgi:nicotinamide phosphoribosyltransferase